MHDPDAACGVYRVDRMWANVSGSRLDSGLQRYHNTTDHLTRLAYTSDFCLGRNGICGKTSIPPWLSCQSCWSNSRGWCRLDGPRHWRSGSQRRGDGIWRCYADGHGGKCRGLAASDDRFFCCTSPRNCSSDCRLADETRSADSVWTMAQSRNLPVADDVAHRLAICRQNFRHGALRAAACVDHGFVTSGLLTAYSIGQTCIRRITGHRRLENS